MSSRLIPRISHIEPTLGSFCQAANTRSPLKLLLRGFTQDPAPLAPITPTGFVQRHSAPSNESKQVLNVNTYGINPTKLANVNTCGITQSTKSSNDNTCGINYPDRPPMLTTSHPTNSDVDKMRPEALREIGPIKVEKA